MFIEVEPNPNTEISFNMVYRNVSEAREVFCIKYQVGTEDQPVQVTGWDAGTNTPCPAYACKVEESGDGIALLIYGGSGGIRMKPFEDESPWDAMSSNQWGESHLVYPVDSFIVYKDEF
ncbi:MAG: hypothetical protein O3A78_03700 [Nitrospinae bacterium]|jgi:hypothetical protein|nr:hypothetical protein [Nitrospinota bacterium]MDA1108912.1 hypothetical protein [Nitrospinota bacterium]